MTTNTTIPLAGQVAKRTASRTGGRTVAARHAKRSERNAWRVEAAAEIAALRMVTVR
jgi:hypothetical protein